MDLCRRVIRHNINKERISQGKISELNLPKTIKDYLEYKDRTTAYQQLDSAKPKALQGQPQPQAAAAAATATATATATPAAAAAAAAAAGTQQPAN